jgi:cobalt-zinc-cadmium efflux system membrane fusion protein
LYKPIKKQKNITKKAKEEGSHKEGEEKEHKEDKSSKNFEKVEVLKGVSDMGYTAVTFVNEIPANAKIVVKGAFFVNAKLSNTGGHEH